MTAAFISQISGLTILSEHLILCVAVTFFVGLALALILHIAYYTLDIALAHSAIVGYRLTARFGTELGIRIKKLLKVVVYSVGFVSTALDMGRVCLVEASGGKRSRCSHRASEAFRSPRDSLF